MTCFRRAEIASPVRCEELRIARHGTHQKAPKEVHFGAESEKEARGFRFLPENPYNRECELEEEVCSNGDKKRVAEDKEAHLGQEAGSLGAQRRVGCWFQRGHTFLR